MDTAADAARGTAEEWWSGEPHFGQIGHEAPTIAVATYHIGRAALALQTVTAYPNQLRFIVGELTDALEEITEVSRRMLSRSDVY